MKRFLPKQKGILILFLALFAGMGTAYAYSFSATCSTGQTLYYNITDATNRYVEVTYPGTSTSNPWQGYTQPTGNITLPSTVTYNGNTYTVKRIGDYAFRYCSGLTGSLTIPNTVTEIGYRAFYGCNGFTGSLTLSSSVTIIGNSAFSECDGLTGSLTIPNSVTTIGLTAFGDCSGFTGSLTIGNSVTTISYGAFFGCSGFTGTLTIPNSVTTIGDHAFQGCSGFTGSLTIPNSVTEICTNAFYNCSGFTESLTIGTGVTSIGQSAFCYCTGFTSMTVYPETPPTLGENAFMNISATIPVTVSCGTLNAYQNASGWNAFTNIQEYCNSDPLIYSINADGVSVTVTGHVDGTAATGELIIPETKTINGITYTVTAIGNDAFYGCSGLTGSLTLPNSVTTIGSSAFRDCSGFTGSLTIPNSVTTIGSSAFRDCSGFTGSLTISNSVTTIGYGTFWNCSGFTGSLNIPNSVTTIGMYAFENCSGFTGSLTIPNSVTSIGNSAFNDCSGFTGSLTIPNSVTSIGISAFNGCSGFTGSLTISNSVTTIDYGTFLNCSGFTGSLIISNSVTTIGMCAFQGCSGFTGSLTIPNSVTSIGTDAFYNCYGFTGTLTLPNSVTSIGEYAFYSCSGFTGSLTLPNSVTSIGNYAFFNCNHFTGSLTIGTGVTSIGQSAFCYCTGFTSMTVYPETPPTLGTDVFQNVPKTIPVYVPCELLSAYQNASGWSAFTNIQGVGCDPLTYSINADGVSVTVTGHVDGTAATGELIIPETKTINGVTYTVTAIGDNAFNACSGFIGSLTIPNSVTAIGNNAFNGCTGFTGLLTLPNSVTSIGEYAFYNCTGFSGSLTIPNSVTTIGEYAFYNCRGFTSSLTIPNSVTTIGDYAFYHCSGFTGTLTLPNSVASIGSYAFANCSGFTGSLTIPNSVTTIGDSAFANCSGFTGTLTIPNSVTTIGDHAFTYCNGFNGSLTIGNSVTSIGNSAFYNCTGFTGSLTIGNSMTLIKSDAFNNCNGLTSMTVYPQTPPTMALRVFHNVPRAIPVYVLCSSLEDYQAASQWNTFANMQCLQETLTVYDGTATNDHVPAYIYYFDEFTKSQFVIPAADLADMTGTPINSITFYTIGGSVPYTTESSADVYLKKVNYTHISAFEPKASATIVYSGYFDIVSTGSGGEMTIYFDSPYTYNGGNLLVGIENTENNTYKNIHFYGQTVSGASVSGSSSSSLGSVQPTQQNFIPKTTFSYTPSACTSPTGLTATDITSNSAMLNWTGFQEDYDLRYKKNDETGGWVTLYNIGSSYSLSALEPATEYEWQVRGRDCDGSGTFTGWSAARSFTTAICSLEDQCELTFELTDGYGDGWNGAAIRVVDAESNILIASMSASNHGLSNTTTTDTYTLAVCDGRELRFEWVNGVYDSECSYTVTNSNGDEIFSGSGAMSAPVTYMVSCSAVVQTTELVEGWNWFSLSLEADDPVDMLDALKASLGDNGLRIESSNFGTDYLGNGEWFGDLDYEGLSNEQLYLIETSVECTVELQGMPANPANHEITIYPGYNWIGFPCFEGVSLADALAGFDAEEEDMIESNYDSAVFFDGEWIGLETLTPGQGYMYFSNSDEPKTLIFQTGAKAK